MSLVTKLNGPDGDDGDMLLEWESCSPKDKRTGHV